MNIKYTVKNVDTGRVISCVLDGEKDIELQLEQVFQIAHGHGIAAYAYDDRIELTDYYHASSMAEFKIISREETKEPLSLKWTDVE